jgi:hypothetical protein
MPDAQPAVVVTVVRSGGIAGLRRRWRADATADAASRWIALIDDCPWDQPPPQGSGADRFVWHISVGGQQADDRSVDLPDEAVSGPWQKLVDEVQASGDPVG